MNDDPANAAFRERQGLVGRGMVRAAKRRMGREPADEASGRLRQNRISAFPHRAFTLSLFEAVMRIVMEARATFLAILFTRTPFARAAAQTDIFGRRVSYVVVVVGGSLLFDNRRSKKGRAVQNDAQLLLDFALGESRARSIITRHDICDIDAYDRKNESEKKSITLS